MFQVPLTFLFDFEHTTDKSRPYVMQEFAANGARHLVLTDTLISMILKHSPLEAALQKEMAAAGLTFVDSHAPFGPLLDLNCPEPGFRKQMIARHKLTLELVAGMGVDTVTIHVGNNHWLPPEEASTGKNIARIDDALEAILPTAEACGVTVCIENIWFTTNTPEVLLDLKKKFPTDALGFCYDSGHANLMDRGRDLETGPARTGWANAGYPEVNWENRALEKMLPHVVNCHLHDNDGTDDQHREPGRGNTDWPHIIRLLRRAPRLKSIQSEVIPVRAGLPIRTLCEIFHKLAEIE